MNDASTSKCTTPISWLRLERYHLGELAPSDHDDVADHLTTCKECRGLLQRIAEDDRALPPLEPTPSTTTGESDAPELRATTIAGRPWYAAHPRTTAIVSSLALAAVLMIAIGRKPSVDVEPGQVDVRAKGAEVSFTLVREDEAVIAEAGGAYRDGERFKALVTCPPGMKASFDVAVFERGDVSFPLLALPDLPCGNAVPIAGAFRVTGHERMTVCLVWQAEGTIDRESVRRTPPDVLPNAHCKTLEPAP